MPKRKKQPRTPGLAELKKWRESTGASHIDIARATGKSPAAVYGWLKGTYRPEGEARVLLAAFTGGVVPEDSWLTDEEREARVAVQPFAANDSTKAAS
jgi:transcriptional regulator with XRE-family HTH domain